VVDEDGVELLIPVPRFLCRRRGPRRVRARTFSVLPAEVIPRRKWCLSLLLKVALWCQESLTGALERLIRLGLVVEARQLERLLAVLGIACERLLQHPLDGVEVGSRQGRREQARELVAAVQGWSAAGRGPPGGLVMAWQERWGLPWLDIRLG